MLGLFAAVALALCVAAIGGLFGQVEVQAPTPEWLAAVIILIGAGAALWRFGLYGFWHNLMTRLRRYGSPD
jgi:hypothetical protein